MKVANTKYVDGQKANTLEKYVRLLKKDAGFNTTHEGHPTKKKTKGRKRHFSAKVLDRQIKNAEAYSDLLKVLYDRAVSNGPFGD